MMTNLKTLAGWLALNNLILSVAFREKDHLGWKNSNERNRAR